MWTQATREGAMNAVVQLPNGGDLLVVGWQNEGGPPGGIGKRYLARVNPLGVDDASKVVWEATNFGDSRNSHGAWEMIDISSDGQSIILSGVRNIPSLKNGDGESAMSFKSYGNVEGGTAVVMQIPITSLDTAPTNSSATWTKTYAGEYTTAKAARPIPNTDQIAVLLWGERTDANSAMLDKLRAFDGVSQLSGERPINFGVAHGEGTDIAVSADGTSIYITGHGSAAPAIRGENRELYGKITKVRVSDYVQQFTKGYASCDVSVTATCWPIKNECWGIATLEIGNVVVACGTGIEDCNSLPPDQSAQCSRGNPITGVDTRSGAVPYRVATWRSLAIEVDSDGNVVWQRVDAYKGEDDTNPAEHGSSASEYVFVKSDGNLGFVQDEVSGVGVFVLGGTPVTEAPGTPVTQAPGATEAPDTPGVTEPPSDGGDGDDDDEDNSSSSDDDDDNKVLFIAVGVSAGVLVVIVVMYFVCCRSMLKN